MLEQVLVGRGSDPFQYGAFRGLKRARRDLHIQAKAVAPSPTGADTYIAPYYWLVRQHYDLVIGVGFLELDALGRTARRFPHQRFGLLDATRRDVPGHPANLEGTIFHTEQGAFLAGFIAARIADQGPRPHVVSSVGGIDIPPVDAYIAGFEAGARRADPRIKLLRAFSGSFTTTAPCANAATTQIDQGSKVVFNVAGECGIAALKTAQKRGAYGIGVDTDQSNLGGFILTSVVKNLDLAVYHFADEVVHGRLRTGGNVSFDLKNHGVYLGRFSPEVSPSLRRQVRQLQWKIVHGKIVVPSTLSPPH